MTGSGGVPARLSTSLSWPVLAYVVVPGAGACRSGIDRLCRTPRANAPAAEPARAADTFSRQLIDSQEGERLRISNEMHDSLGQDLGIIRKLTRARRERAADGESAQQTLNEIGAVAERIDAEMKEIAYGLRPHQLDTIGLSKTIESMVRRVAGACDVEFVTDIEPIDELFPQSSHIHIFRIVQEAVSNIVRHSKASRARAIVANGVASVVIRVEDNGTGFSPDLRWTGSTKHGFGLVGICERARILGGRVEILFERREPASAVVVTLPSRARPMDEGIRIVIAEDHPFFLDGLRRVLEKAGSLTVVGEALRRVRPRSRTSVR